MLVDYVGVVSIEAPQGVGTRQPVEDIVPRIAREDVVGSISGQVEFGRPGVLMGVHRFEIGREDQRRGIHKVFHGQVQDYRVISFVEVLGDRIFQCDSSRNSCPHLDQIDNVYVIAFTAL